MIDPKKVTPLLSNMTVDCKVGNGPNGVVNRVTRRLDGRRLALKHISIPASDAQTKALIFAGAVNSEAEAQRYYSTLVKEIKSELLMLNGISNASNLLKFRGYQIDQKYVGAGYDVYLLSDFCVSLPEYVAAHPLTHLQAINLALDLCAGLDQLRSANLVHKDIRPTNVFLTDNRHFAVGDLGLVTLDELPYSSMPDQLVTDYTAPEVRPAEATLSDTMDIYSVGLILYEIYNGNVLPPSDNGTYYDLPAPEYADSALADIILRACAPVPADRYQSPGEMRQALVLYMQKANISNLPLIPLPTPEEDASVDVATIAATVTAGQVAEDLTSLGELPPPVDEDGNPLDVAHSEEPDPGFILDQPVPVAPPRSSLNELKDGDLLVPTQGEISLEDFLASLRGTSGLEVMSMDASGNTTIVPGYETEETLPADTEYIDSADNHNPAVDDADNVLSDEPASPLCNTVEPVSPLDNADELALIQSQLLERMASMDEETSQLPIEESTPVEDSISAEESASAEKPVPRRRTAPQPARRQTAPQAGQRRRRPQPVDPNPNNYDDDEYDLYDDGYEDDEYEPAGSTWKRALIAVIVLLILAGGTFGLYVFKTDTVTSIQSEVLSSSSVQITADLKKDTSAVVVCSTDSGEVARMSYEDGAIFTGLNPSTTYTFTIESSDGMLLLGSKTTTAKTNQMTNLSGFAVTSLSAVKATLAISGTGDQPEVWIVTLTSESGETITAESDTYTIDMIGLTPATTYTATIVRGDGEELSGTTTCTFTTMDYTVLESFQMTDVDTSSTSVAWSYSGTVPDSWTVTCEGTDGSSLTQEVSGTECVLDNLTAGETYTITLSCDSLQTTEENTVSVGIPSVTIDSIISTQNENGEIEVSWEYSGNTTPAEWSISYVYDCATDVTPTLVTSDTNSVVLTELIPNATYTITISGADGLYVGGNANTICTTESADSFTGYGCSDVSITLYATEDTDTATTTFTTAQNIAFVIQASYDASDDDKTVSTTYIIRNYDGTPVYVYESERSWSGSWTTARHSGDLPDIPQTPGSYILEVYFDGDLMISTSFTVNAA